MNQLPKPMEIVNRPTKRNQILNAEEVLQIADKVNGILRYLEEMEKANHLENCHFVKYGWGCNCKAIPSQEPPKEKERRVTGLEHTGWTGEEQEEEWKYSKDCNEGNCSDCKLKWDNCLCGCHIGIPASKPELNVEAVGRALYRLGIEVAQSKDVDKTNELIEKREILLDKLVNLR